MVYSLLVASLLLLGAFAGRGPLEPVALIRWTLEPQPSNERIKIMVKHGNAKLSDQTPHAKSTKQTRQTSAALKRRAQSVFNDTSIDAASRAVIRYGLETNDPWLPALVRRVNAGDYILDRKGFLLRRNFS
jgi:hypothetical protein